ncbi:DUF202 domain-containing protein [Streptomyces parvus]|uniref:DUF202 domain-containing protein n=1 Tax=Streptomyces parvus TaxID=66428 RepID=UPI00367422F2
MANERTLLAWLRTALALLAASFAVVKLIDITPRGLRLALGGYLVALSIGSITAGYAQWRDRENGIAAPRGRLPAPGGALTLAMLLLAALVITVIVLAP